MIDNSFYPEPVALYLSPSIFYFNLFLQLNSDSITSKFTGQAYNWIVTIGPRLLVAMLVFLLGQWLIRLVNKGLSKVLSVKRFDATLRPFIQNLLQILMQVLLVLALMQILGIQMTLFAAVIGAFGVAVGLSLSGTLQNFASGILIILMKPFRVGDNIRTQGEEGTVTAIKLFYTVIRTYANTTLIVPNSKLSNEVIFNLTRQPNRRMDLLLKLAPEADFTLVKKKIGQALGECDNCLNEPEARIGIESIEVDHYTVTVNAWVKSHGYQDARLQLNELLLKELKPLLQKKKEPTA